jgi:hypothetical protein
MKTKKLKKYIIFPIKYKAIYEKEKIESDNNSSMKIKELTSDAEYRIYKNIDRYIEEYRWEKH